MSGFCKLGHIWKITGIKNAKQNLLAGLVASSKVIQLMP